VASGFADYGPTQWPDSSIPNLGSYITEQTMAFCQTVFHKTLVDEMTADIKFIDGIPTWVHGPNDTNPIWWNERILKHMLDHPEDPLPLPSWDPGT